MLPLATGPDSRFFGVPNAYAIILGITQLEATII